MGDFQIRGWRRRLRALLAGRVDAVSAVRSPIIVRRFEGGCSLDVGALPDRHPYSGGRPILYAEWQEPPSTPRGPA